MGANAIELSVIDSSNLEKLETLSKYVLKPFAFRSIHMPTNIYYKNNKDTKELLKRIEYISRNLNISNVVLHPDTIQSLKIFEEYDVPFSIENMDRRKKFGKDINEIRYILENTNFRFVLDINHIYTIDKSLKLAEHFIEEFMDKIVEIHLSGCENYSHVALLKTKQKELIEKIKSLNKPIIIESVFDSLNDIQKEWDFIMKFNI